MRLTDKIKNAINARAAEIAQEELDEEFAKLFRDGEQPGEDFYEAYYRSLHAKAAAGDADAQRQLDTLLGQ